MYKLLELFLYISGCGVVWWCISITAHMWMSEDNFDSLLKNLYEFLGAVMGWLGQGWARLGGAMGWIGLGWKMGWAMSWTGQWTGLG